MGLKWCSMEVLLSLHAMSNKKHVFEIV